MDLLCRVGRWCFFVLGWREDALAACRTHDPAHEVVWFCNEMGDTDLLRGIAMKKGLRRSLTRTSSHACTCRPPTQSCTHKKDARVTASLASAPHRREDFEARWWIEDGSQHSGQ